MISLFHFDSRHLIATYLGKELDEVKEKLESLDRCFLMFVDGIVGGIQRFSPARLLLDQSDPDSFGQ